jgi:hypothetical protein
VSDPTNIILSDCFFDVDLPQNSSETDHYVTLSVAKNALYRKIDEAYRFERWNVGADLENSSEILIVIQAAVA